MFIKRDPNLMKHRLKNMHRLTKNYCPAGSFVETAHEYFEPCLMFKQTNCEESDKQDFTM